MGNGEQLKYSEEKLFNSERLHQYDEDGQKGFLGYLIRNRNWEINNNTIIFPEIRTTEKIEKALSDYNISVLKDILYTKREALSAVTRLGTYNYEKILDKQIKEIEKNEDNKKVKRKDERIL